MQKISHHVYNDEPRGEDLELKPMLDMKTFYKPTAQNANDILQIK